MVLISLAIVTAQNTAAYKLNKNNPGVITGSLFLGAMSATQSNMFNTQGNCYQNALIVQTQLESMLYNMDVGVILNQFQVANIKLQACLDACNL